jgi:hypothetical protein
MKNAIGFAAALFALLSLLGCASPSGAVRNLSPLTSSQPVSLDNILVVTASSAGDLTAEKQLLGDTLISGLSETEMFVKVTGNPADAGSGNGVKLKAEIREIKKVSDDARDWVGPLAGRARILVHVTVADLNSGNQIAAFDAEGLSGKSAFAGTTDEAIQMAVEQIVAQVLKINAQTSQ